MTAIQHIDENSREVYSISFSPILKNSNINPAFQTNKIIHVLTWF